MPQQIIVLIVLVFVFSVGGHTKGTNPQTAKQKEAGAQGTASQIAPGRFKHVIKLVKPKPSNALSFEDVNIKIQFLPGSQLSFILTNKTETPLEVLWGRASLVDMGSQAHRVMHAGVRYIERDRELPPTVIPPMAMITDTVVPTDYISYDRDSSRGWQEHPFLDPPLAKYEGKTFSLFLPLKIGAATKDYFFSFTIAKEPLAPGELTAERTQKAGVCN